MNKIKNFTPHEIVVIANGIETRYPSEGVARVKSEETQVSIINGIEIYQQVFGDIEGLPEPEKDTFIIVSAMVLSANKSSKNPRWDLIAPNTGATAIRENGQIKAVTSFVI